MPPTGVCSAVAVGKADRWFRRKHLSRNAGLLPPRKSIFSIARQPMEDIQATPRKVWWLAAGAFLFLLGGCAPPSPFHDGMIDDAAVKRISKHIEEVRTLHFKQEVQFDVITPTVAADRFMDHLAKQYGSRPTLELALEAETALGLVAGQASAVEPIQFEEMGARQLANTWASIIFTSADRIEVVDGGGERIDQSVPTLARAILLARRPKDFLEGRFRTYDLSLTYTLAVALVYQNFPIETKTTGLRTNLDAHSALLDVVEGDALLVTDAVTRRPSNPADVCSRKDQESGLWERMLRSELEPVPPAFKQMLTGVSENKRFVCRAFKSGGWQSVNDLYEKPPYSIRQISDPSRYFGTSPIPFRITISGYEDVLPGWTKGFENTYGPGGLAAILKSIPSGNVSGLADEWVGVQVVGLTRDRDFSALWVVAFSSPRAAATFCSVYKTGHVLPGQKVPIRLSQKDNAVLVVTGPASDNFERLSSSLWKKTRIEEVFAK